MPAQWLIEGDVTKLKDVFKKKIETRVINESESLDARLSIYQSINQSINFNLNSHKHYFYSVQKEK